MRKHLLSTAVLFLVTTSLAYPTTDQSVATAAPHSDIPQSSAGFAAQFSATVGAYQSGDKALGKQLIEQFRLPQPERWFAGHMSPEQGKVLTERYDALFASFAAEVESNILLAVDNHLSLVTELKDGTEEPLPKGPHTPPLSGITTTSKTALYYARFERQRNGTNTGSWARAFTYEDGAFRFVGFGSKPFWIWENDSLFTRPRSEKPMQLAKVIHQVPASYPASALAKGISGKVILKLAIDAQGKVTDATVLSGDPALTQAAIEAARKWQFEAPLRDGSPIESLYIAEFHFGNQ
jgi:TonB family protein